jgi:hypothetical protein
MVTADFDRHKELSNALHASGRLDGYGEIIGAAFFVAVRKQFEGQGGYSPEDVIRLVADTRAMLDLSGDVIDPRVAELVVRSALGEGGLLGGIDPSKIAETQMAVCSYLAEIKRLGDPDTFMGEVQQLLDEWAADDEAAPNPA